MDFAGYQVKGALTPYRPALVISPFPSTGGPDLAIYAAWAGVSGDTPLPAAGQPLDIWYSYCTDGIGATWSTPAQIKGKGWQAETDQGPALALATLEDGPPWALLYAAWKGQGTGAREIWYSTTPDGVNWSDQQKVMASPSESVKTPSGPALAAYGGAYGGPIAVAWRGSDNSLSWTTLGGGSESLPALPVSGAESDKEAAIGSVAVDGTGPIFAWKKSDNTIWTGGEGIPGGAVKASDFTAYTSEGPSLPPETFTSWPIGLAWKGTGEEVWVSKNFPYNTASNPLTEYRVPGASTDKAPAYLGAGGMLAFKANTNLVVKGVPVEQNTLWVCTP